jgi:hypothetical protein
MPSESHIQIAAEARRLAASGRYHGKATELVKTFGVPFTTEGIHQVVAALAAQGLVSKPPLSQDRPNDHVTVVIVGGSAASVSVRVEDIDVFAGEPGRPYRVVGPLKTRVTAATVFSKTPTVEDVNLKIREQAVRLGANAVINVNYSRGVSATSWKALTAEGTAVVVDGVGLGPEAAQPSQLDPVERIRQLAALLESGAITADEFAATKQKLLDQM